MIGGVSRDGISKAHAGWKQWLEHEDHLSFEELSRLVDGRAQHEERFAMSMHLAHCRMCREEAADLIEFASELGADAVSRADQFEIARRWREALVEEGHVPYEILAQSADGTLAADDRVRLDAHLRACAVCRDEAGDLLAFSRTPDPERPRTWRRRALQVAAAVAVAAALAVAIGIERIQPAAVYPPALQASTRSMAVLPLRNVTGRPEDEFLSIGIADALATRLEHDPSLAMRSMASIMALRRQSADLETATEQLDVDVLLEGDFLAVEDVVRVTLKLTEVRSGQALWSEAIEGQRGDLLRLVDQMTARTASRLSRQAGARSLGSSRASDSRSRSPQAYEEYLRARSVAGSLVRTQYEAQVAALEKAIELDPTFAAAHADLAIALELGGVARSLANSDDTIDVAERHAREAIRLDSRLPEAHVALGRVLSKRPGRFPEAVREVVTALELNPASTQALSILASYYAAAGEFEKARCLAARVEALDPFSDEVKTQGYWRTEANDSAGALREAERAMADSQTRLAGHDIRGLAFLNQGNLDAADREAQAALTLAPDHYLGKSLKAMISAGRGQRAQMESWLTSFEVDATRNHFAAKRVALCWARLGERATALDWVERSTALGHHRWYSMVRHPWLQSLRSEPRFQVCVERIKRNLGDARADAGRAYARICGAPDRDERRILRTQRTGPRPSHIAIGAEADARPDEVVAE